MVTTSMSTVMVSMMLVIMMIACSLVNLICNCDFHILCELSCYFPYYSSLLFLRRR